ncbi:MAG: HlyC/CorC family transporter [Gammaproteobacteria bacterium]|nr:HlyC/CorC family transporter [Gammaproteobacteria bacterium]
MNISELSTELLSVSIAILVVLSAYFSGSETAMVALNRYRLRHLVKEGHGGARKADRLLQRPDRLLGVILIGNNLVNFTAASLATVLGIRLFGDTGVVVAPVAITIIFLIFSEVAPKTIAAQLPEQIAFRSAYILSPLLKILYPGVLFINWFSNALVKPFLPRPDDDTAGRDSLTADELRTVVNEGVVMPAQGQNMMLSILDLEHVTVDDIMVPRAEIIGVDVDDDMSDILSQLASSQHTRLPVYKDNIDNMLGILHLRRVARFLPSTEMTKADIMQLTEEPYYVPEATPLHTQLINFQKEKKRIALVVNEYGDVRGIVTLEDILEEIVGEFTTDFAANIPEIHPQDDGSYLIDGLALLRDINRALGWDLPVHGPKTLNGLVLEHLETLPESNLCLRIGDYLIETLQIKDNVIKNLKISRASAAPGDAAE